MAFVVYDKERRVLEAIAQYINRYGYGPTLKEVGEMTGMRSPATVHEHTVSLIQKGYLVKLGSFKRGFDLAPQVKKRFLENVEAAIEIPLFGFIAAGSPLEPHPDPSVTIPVPSSMINQRQAYALQVKGESMKDDGILEGDYVIIEYTETAVDGDIVIAYLEDRGMAVLKRFFRENGRIALKPANSQMQPIYSTSVKIQGKVVGLLRRF